jgi:formate hydrogenlyase subunit 4
MTWLGVFSQLLEIVMALLLAPLLGGWINQWRAWLQNKSAPGLLQPYRMLHKLFNKESVLAEHASPLFRGAPYIVFGCMALACAIIPTLSTDLPLSPAADAIALVGLFALARVFISLAAMDVGTSFGTLGARREMLIGFLAEPALLMVLFSASLISKSTSLTTIVETLAHRELAIYPEPGFRRRRLHHGLAGRKRACAGGQPGDPPRTDDDPRGADPRVFGPPPGLLEWAASLKLFAYSCIGLALFFPWGVAEAEAPLALLLAMPALILKLAIGGALLAVLETLSAKMRIFRVPEFLATAFLLAVIGMLVTSCWPHEMTELVGQLINLLAAILLMLAFAMISQRRILSLIHLFTAQGAPWSRRRCWSATPRTSRTSTCRRASRWCSR